MKCLVVIQRDKVTAYSAAAARDSLQERDWKTGEDLQAALTELIGGLPLSQVCFGLGSELCFSCRFSRPMSGKRLTHDALRFLAEDQLPISAEDFTCVLQADGEDVCCLAAERHVVQAAAAVTRGKAAVIPVALLVAASRKFPASRKSANAPDGRNECLSFTLLGRLETVELSNSGWAWFSDAGGAKSPEVDCVDLQEHVTAGMLNVRKAAAFDLTNDVSLGAVGGAAGGGVQRLCQILLVAAVVMIFALVSRRNRIAVELGTVEEQQLVAYREIFAGGRGQGMVRKLKGELSRRKSLSEEFGRWRSTHPAACELWSTSVATIAGRPLTSLESVRADGTRAEIDVRIRNRSQSSQLQMWLSDVGLLVEPPVVKPSGRAFRATLVTGRGESE